MMSPAIKQSAQRKAYLNANIVAPAQGLNGKGGILVEDGWILAVGPKVTQGVDRRRHRQFRLRGRHAHSRPHRHAGVHRRTRHGIPRDAGHAPRKRRRRVASPP